MNDKQLQQKSRLLSQEDEKDAQDHKQPEQQEASDSQNFKENETSQETSKQICTKDKIDKAKEVTESQAHEATEMIQADEQDKLIESEDVKKIKENKKEEGQIQGYGLQSYSDSQFVPSLTPTTIRKSIIKNFKISSDLPLHMREKVRLTGGVLSQQKLKDFIQEDPPREKTQAHGESMIEYGLDYYSDSQYDPSIRYSRVKSFKMSQARLREEKQWKKSSMILRNVKHALQDQEEETKQGKDEDNNEQILEGNSLVINQGKLLESSLLKESFIKTFEEQPVHPLSSIQKSPCSKVKEDNSTEYEESFNQKSEKLTSPRQIPNQMPKEMPIPMAKEVSFFEKPMKNLKSDREAEESPDESPFEPCKPEITMKKDISDSSQLKHSESYDSLSFRLLQRDKLKQSGQDPSIRHSRIVYQKKITLGQSNLQESKESGEFLTDQYTPDFEQKRDISQTMNLDEYFGLEENIYEGITEEDNPHHTTYLSKTKKLITEVDQKSSLAVFEALTEQAKLKNLREAGFNWLVKLPPSTIFKAVIKIQRFWKKMMHIINRYKRRGYIINELYETERIYVANLEYMIKQQKTLQKNCEVSQTPILSAKEIKTLFSNIQTLRDFNLKFFKEMETRMLNWNQNSMIGDIFVRYAPFFKLYNEYFQNYERSERVYDAAHKRPQFQAYTNQLLKEPESKFLSLNSFLIMPVQRPVKYPLLLKDLLTHTRVTHPDFKNLKKAYFAMREINSKVNADLKRRISELKKIELQKKFGDKVKLVDPSRYLIGEDKLVLLTSGWSSREVQVIFFNDKLLLLSHDGDSYVGNMNLDASSFVKNAKDLKYFQNIITITGGTKSFSFSAQTLTSKLDILDKLNSIISQLKSSLEARKTALRNSFLNEGPPGRKSMLLPGKSDKRVRTMPSNFDIRLELDNPFLKESPLMIDIVGTEWRFTHTVYIIQVTRGKQTNRIFKRYSQFDKLYKKLTSKWPQLLLPKLPKKRWLTFKTKVVEERKLLLQKFLQEIVLYKAFENDNDLLQFLQITDWALEFDFDGNLASDTPISQRWNQQQKTEDIQISFCNRTTLSITVPLDTKAVEVQYYLAKQCGIKNYREWGLYILEPNNDEKLIDPFDRPFDNMKKHKGMFESAISKFSSRSKLNPDNEASLAGFLKIKEACFLFKRVIFPSQFFQKDNLESLHPRQLELLYAQCLAAIATNFIKLKTGDLIEFSAFYLLFTFGIREEAHSIIKEQILKLVSKKNRDSKIIGFWEERILERWQVISQMKIKREFPFDQKSPDFFKQKIIFLRGLKNKSFFGTSFYWVEPYGQKNAEIKVLTPCFWLGINFQKLYFLQASTYSIVKQFDIQNVALQIYPTALIINVYSSSPLFRASVAKRSPQFSFRVNTPRGFEIQNLMSHYQNEGASKQNRSRSIF